MDALSYKTVSANKSTVNKRWYVVDAEGKTLGRLSSGIAKIIRGKNKPDFTPHVDCGDNIIVLNASKIKLSRDKMITKEYVSYSGYPGGQKLTSARNLLAKKPEALVEKAVKGMLPKNRLGRQIFNNLYVFAGNEHPHQAQKPETIEI
ncbi:MAG: 50S ribosomal protein L13 [Flavobacteriales bacterium]|nr:50S ribosomal protein L13 [Flavobacteriales bacterium]